MFHAHCLSPYRFYTDTQHYSYSRDPWNKNHHLWNLELSFPLERLHTLIASGAWSDEQSKLTWESLTGTPYQLWAADPATGATLQLQGVEITCPRVWCGKVGIVDLDQFTLTHTTKSATTACPKCHCKFNADGVSAEFLRRDLLRFRQSRNGW